MLSQEKREELAKLLPQTAFFGFEPTLDPEHPAMKQRQNDLAIENEGASSSSSNFVPHPDMVNLSVFTDGHFLAAAHTFQDHLCSGWMVDTHVEKVKTFEQGVKDGTVHAPWKDEVWEREASSDTVPLNTKYTRYVLL